MTRPAHRRDLSLAGRCATGDREALEELVDDYYGSVVNFIHRFTSRRDDAQDLAQEVFVKALRAIGGYDGKASLRTWLFTIAANCARDLVRRRRRRQDVIADEPELALLESVADPTADGHPAKRAVATLQAATVRRAVENLPEAHRMTVILRFYHDLSLQEIAEVSGCTIGTVGSRLHYAMKKLQRILEAEPGAVEALGAAGGGECS